MTRDLLPIETSSLNTIDTAAGLSINTSNDAYISPGGDMSSIVLVFNHSGGTDGTTTFKAGDNPPAFEAGLGDLAITVPNTAVSWVTIDPARFMQDDGTINIDFDATMAGTMYALRLPRASR